MKDLLQLFRKKFITIMIMAMISPKLFAAFSPLGLSIFPPIQFPPEKWSVYGLRLALPYAKHYYMYGLDLGILNVEEKGGGIEIGIVNIVKNYVGIQIGLANLTTHNYILQVGLFNHAKGTLRGMQLGIYNQSKNAKGLQLGLINYTQDLDGVQIGLININLDGLIPVFPIINIGF